MASESIDTFLRAVCHAPEMTPPTALPAIGTVLCGEFELREELGRGGMGAVFRAHDRTLDREVAIKVMRVDRWPRSALPRLAAIFDREARATARLNHPGIVTLFRAGRDGEIWFLVLELLAGESLAARLARGPLRLDEAISLIGAVCAALGHAHRAGVLHRDVKPQNVFCGGDGRITLLDFGLASLDDELAAAEQLARSRAGTPAYMAPEQWRGDPQDERTDVWAVGILLQHAIGDSPPAPIAEVIARATMPGIDDRYPSIAELDAALRRARAQVTEPLPRARAGGRRRWWRSAVLVAAVAAVVGVATMPGSRADRPRPPELAEGVWRASPAEGTAWLGELRRVDAYHYEWRYSNAPEGAEPSGAYTLHAGVLALDQRDGRWFLDGEVRDLPGWCCGYAGVLGFAIEGPRRLDQVVSRWGNASGDYQYEFPPWSFEWVAASR